MLHEKTRILVVDDDNTLLGAVRRLLTAAGFEVLTSDSALRLPQLVQREKPDLVLLDIEMPALSGEHVLEMTKLFEFLQKTPIVIHSAKSDEELTALVAKSNAVGYIKKTGNPMSLVSQVQKCLQKD